MDFSLKIRELAARLDIDKDHVFSEEATKLSMVNPLLQILGYDIANPKEIIPEYTAGFNIIKSEKVDYAIAFNGEPKILIESKNVNSFLQHKDAIQLYKYFGATKASINIAILTNGIQYQFFSDLDNIHKMDDKPFFIVDIIPSIKDFEIEWLRRFHKLQFDSEKILLEAREFRCVGELKNYFQDQLNKPVDAFVKFIIKQVPSFGSIPKNKFSFIVQNALKQFVDETIIEPTTPPLKPPEWNGRVVVKPTSNDLCYKFWDQLLEYAKTKTDLHAKIKPTKYEWLGRGSHGLWFNYVVRPHQSRAELWIDKGKNAEIENKGIFDKLAAAKAEIEQIFGGPLEGRRMDENRACCIRKQITLGGYRDEEQNWPKIHEAMVGAMIRLEAAFSPHIQYLRK
jgi:predicted type IV restriction endonuclease